MLKLCKDHWIPENKSHCLGWGWHLSFWDTAGHLGTLSKKGIQIWELPIWEKSSWARSAVQIHGAGVEELDGVPRLIPGMGSSETWMSYLHVSLYQWQEDFVQKFELHCSSREMFIQHTVHWPCGVCGCHKNTKRVSLFVRTEWGWCVKGQRNPFAPLSNVSNRDCCY